MIRTVKISDAKEISNIYNYYILNTIITFEESEISFQDMEERISNNFDQKLPWLVYEENNNILGYAYSSKWKSRSAYRNTLEITVYVNHESVGQGIGEKLYAALLKQIRDLKYHAVIGGIALPNETSIKLHEKMGFEKVAHFKEVGYKFGKYIDVGYWELIL